MATKMSPRMKKAVVIGLFFAAVVVIYASVTSQTASTTVVGSLMSGLSAGLLYYSLSRR